MPFRPTYPIVRVEPESMHTIDTSKQENLFGLWSMFSKCADAMTEGKRYEYATWRLWTREVCCVTPCQGTKASRQFASSRWRPLQASSSTVPELSSSVESDSSLSDGAVQSAASSTHAEPQNAECTEPLSKSMFKHITPVGLEKIVKSIEENKELAPLSPLPVTLSTARVEQPQPEPVSQEQTFEDTQQEEVPTEVIAPQPAVSTQHIVPDSSTSTVVTAISSDNSNMSPPVGSDTSTSTDLSSHSVVHGFAIGRISSSTRSKCAIASPPQPTPILKPSNQPKTDASKKKGAKFTLGGSSDEGGESSLETHMSLMQRSSLSEGIKRVGLGNRKQASFKDEVSTKMIPRGKEYQDEQVFESDSEEEDEVDESAIEDDDEDDWEDSISEDGEDSEDQQPIFQRVDSKPNLVSRRSLLTNLLHENDRAKALQNEASRSTPALRRSRILTPNGPSLAASPQEDTSMPEAHGTQIPRKPAIMTTSNIHQPALSPRTTRRNMLSTELSESLRRNLLWERQQKNVNGTAAAALKRRHTSTDVKNLKKYPGESRGIAPGLPPLKETSFNNSWNVFEHGLQEYHQTGW